MRKGKKSLQLTIITLLLIGKTLTNLMHEDEKKDLILTKRTQKNPPIEGQCLEGLVESYGLFSTGTVHQKPLSVCPTSPNTCCHYNSQKMMIIQMKSDLKKIKLRMHDQDKVIEDLFHELKLDMRYIERFKERQHLRSMSNCKAISTKLSMHDVDRVATAMEHAREDMFKFIKSAHKGVYCALCSPEAQRYIDLSEGVLRISNKFCRSVVSNTIKPMMYLHHLFKRFLNMMVRFYNNCDAHGEYTDNLIPDEVTFEYSPDEKIIHQCWKFRNDPDWILQCNAYCDRFNTMKFSGFFEPNLKLFMSVTSFLKKKRMHLNLIERSDDSLNYDSEIRDFEINPTVVPNFDNSKVEDNEHKADEFEEEELDALKRPLSALDIELFLERFKNPLVVSGDIGADYSIADYSYRYHKKGIDFENLGRNAVSTDALLKIVEAKMNSENQDGNTIENPGASANNATVVSQTSGAPGHRKLKKNSVYNNFGFSRPIERKKSSNQYRPNQNDENSLFY